MVLDLHLARVKLLLQCTFPLLWSQNSAAVLAAAGVHWIMSAKEDVKRIVKPLLHVLRSSGASTFVYVFYVHITCIAYLLVHTLVCAYALFINPY